MKTPPVRLLRLLWIACVVLWIAVWLFPESNRITRAAGLALFLGAWLGAVELSWRRRPLRFALIGLTLLGGAFLVLPGRALPAADALRNDYVAGLRRYNGVNYYWGGESPKGIDCSGLIRRGLIDSLFCRGARTLDPGLVRRSLALWWHDTSAQALGEHHEALTVALLATPSINELDHSKVLPGDLAVTPGGVHIMAYLGDRQWIEADPGEGRVITVSVPTKDNSWFQGRMNLVRWSLLAR